jgi:toxin ParE1/3/4
VEVTFTPLAERHLDSLYEYIAAHAGESRADQYISRIVAFCKGLATFPLRGTQRDDLLLGLRVTGFERRVTIAFVVTDAAVLIEGIFYGGRDFETTFRDSEKDDDPTGTDPVCPNTGGTKPQHGAATITAPERDEPSTTVGLARAFQLSKKRHAAEFGCCGLTSTPKRARNR